jgi:hypothetical protein
MYLTRLNRRKRTRPRVMRTILLRDWHADPWHARSCITTLVRRKRVISVSLEDSVLPTSSSIRITRWEEHSYSRYNPPVLFHCPTPLPHRSPYKCISPYPKYPTPRNANRARIDQFVREQRQVQSFFSASAKVRVKAEIQIRRAAKSQLGRITTLVEAVASCIPDLALCTLHPALISVAVAVAVAIAVANPTTRHDGTCAPYHQPDAKQ